MSIQSEINRIAGAKSDIADAIEDKGVTVPSGTKLDGMANLIGQIPAGGSEKLNSTQAADAYDPTATYAVGDKVSYAGNVYSCISAISTPEAWDSTHWDQVDPIQDQVDEVRNTLNHKADVIYDTASGDIASFPDGADGLPVKDLTVAIEPVQSGTGDPSPTNVRPISGWTGCNVTRTDGNTIDTSTNQSGAIDENGNEVANGTINRTDYIPVTGAVGVFKSIIVSGYNIRIHGYNSSKTWVQQIKVIATTGADVFDAFAIPSGIAYIRISYPVAALSTTEFWQGTTIPISWQSEAGTVYAGYVDPVTGEMVADRLMYTSLVRGFIYDSATKWWFNGRLEYVNNKWLENNKQLCNLAPFKSYGELAQNTSLIGFFISKNGDVIIRTGDSENAPTGYQFCVPIAVPQTYQLDPVTVTTLLGQNNVWSDTGAVLNCEYPADTKLYIDKKLAALVAALS